MPRKFNGNGPTQHNAPEVKTSRAAETTDQPKKVWDCFLALEPEEGEESGKLIGAFEIRGGIGEKSGKPYVCLSGYSKEYKKGMNIFLTKNADKLIDVLVAAGYLK